LRRQCVLLKIMAEGSLIPLSINASLRQAIVTNSPCSTLLHAGQQLESNRSHHSKKETEVFSRLYISCQTCESGTILPTWKSNLPTCLVWVEESSHKKKMGLAVVPWWLPKVQSESHPTTAVILDGVVITQMLKPGAAKTFEEYTHQNLLNLLKFIASRAVHCISLTLMIRVHAYAVSAPLKLSSDGAWTVLEPVYGKLP